MKKSVVLDVCSAVSPFLTQRVPPIKVDDLFEEIKDGIVLLSLLEVLSGERLVGCHLCNGTSYYCYY